VHWGNLNSRLTYPDIVQHQLDALIHDPAWLTARQAIWAEKVRPSEATELSRHNLKLLERFFIYGDLPAMLELNSLCTWDFTYSPVVTPESATFFWGEYAAQERQRRGEYYRWQLDRFMDHAHDLLDFYPFSILHNENYFCGISRDTRLKLFDWFFSQLEQETLPFSLSGQQYPEPVALPLKKVWLSKSSYYCDIKQWLSGEPGWGKSAYFQPCLINRPELLIELIKTASLSAFSKKELPFRDAFSLQQYFIWHLLAICHDYSNPFGEGESGVSRQTFVDWLCSYLESDKVYPPLQLVWKRIQAPDVQMRYMVYMAWPVNLDTQYPQLGETLTQWLKRIGLAKNPLWLGLKKQNGKLLDKGSAIFPGTEELYFKEWPALEKGIDFADGMRTLFAEAGCSEVRIWRSFHSFGPQVLAEEESNVDD